MVRWIRKIVRTFLLTATAVAVILGTTVAFAALVLNPRVGITEGLEESILRDANIPEVAEPITLRVLTFNIAVAYLFTTNREERTEAIAAKIAALDPDLVGLQEAWTADEREQLYARLASTSRLRYHQYYPSGTVGSGLLILSAFPIEEVSFYRYRHSNPWWRIWEGDWWAGKGIALARVRLPNGVLLDFYNTHAQATRENPENVKARTKQMAELVDYLHRSHIHTAPAFVVGDFNGHPNGEDIQTAVRGVPLIRLMTLPTELDHIFAIADEHYEYEVMETIAVQERIHVHGADIFLDRAPTPREIWQMWTTKESITTLSDHDGYLSVIRIVPKPHPQSPKDITARYGAEPAPYVAIPEGRDS
jgi:sphingomyelin phosphodiesterase 2